MSSEPTRWTIISDGDSRSYLCPEHLAEEAEENLQAEVDLVPEYVFPLEGSRLTFEKPHYDGWPVEEG